MLSDRERKNLNEVWNNTFEFGMLKDGVSDKNYSRSRNVGWYEQERLWMRVDGVRQR